MARDGKTQPWVWVAAGCGVAVLLGFLVMGGLGFAGWRWARNMERQMEDPDAREAKALEVLGAERIPEGYFAVVAMEIPFAMKMAILSDRRPDPEEGGGEADWSEEDLGERGLFYFEMPSWGNERGNLEDFLEGRTDDAEFLRRSSINLQRGEPIARGEVALPGAERGRYVVQRGTIGDQGEGLTATVLVECAGDRRIRLAIWYGPDPQPVAEPAAETVEVDLAGTVGDPARIGEFLGGFRFCR
jgi:hypothetical protein